MKKCSNLKRNYLLLGKSMLYEARRGWGGAEALCGFKEVRISP